MDIRQSALYPELKITMCDILSPKIKDHIDEGDKILHLCAMPIVASDPTKVFRVNVEGTINLVRYALQAKAERIVMSSSGAVYFGNKEIHPPVDEKVPTLPNTYYGFSKVVGEQVLTMHQFELPFVVLRYGYIYGRGDKGAVSIFIDRLRKNKRAIIFGSGGRLIENVYVKDIVQSNVKALITPNTNQIYNIGTGVALTIRQLYETVAGVVGNYVEPEVKPLRPWDPIGFWYDINKAVRLLGYSPKWTITEGIKDTLKELKNDEETMVR